MINHRAQLKFNRNESGFGLIEVLITLLVVSIGILSVIGMQITVKKASYDAIQRTIASQLANDIIERMRSNPGGIAYYELASTSGLSGSLSCSGGCGTTRSVDDNGTPLDTSDDAEVADSIADYDLLAWKALLDGNTEMKSGTPTGGLVDPVACITKANDANISDDVYTITIAWRGADKLVNQSASTCGQGSYGTSEEYRRLYVTSVFVG